MLHYLPAAIGVLGFAFGLRCYWELYKWAKMCQRASIAIAHNRRVQLTAPLTEWLQWANALGKDEKSKGRVVYRNQKTSVAVLSPQASISAKTTLSKIKRVRLSRSRKRKAVA